MLARHMTPLLLLVTGSALALGQTPTPVREVARIPLPHVEGRIDHMAADADGKRLYVAALGNDSLEVIDLAANRHMASVPGLKKPQGVRYLADARRVAVASGEDGVCRFIDPDTLKTVATIEHLDDADNVRYDPAGRMLYVGYGDGALAVIDPAAARKVADVKLDGHPESFQLETNGPRIFVNVPDAGHVAVVDRAQRRVTAKWPLPDGVAANFPMALDEEHRRLFVACRKPARVLAFDTDTGRVVATADCPGDADDVFYDVARQRLYVTGGDGTLAVIQRTDADQYKTVATVATAPGARTSLFVPSLARLYVAVPHRGGQPAELRAFDVGGR